MCCSWQAIRYERGLLPLGQLGEPSWLLQQQQLQPFHVFSLLQLKWYMR
jgi:hypothetical protein